MTSGAWRREIAVPRPTFSEPFLMSPFVVVLLVFRNTVRDKSVMAYLGR